MRGEFSRGNHSSAQANLAPFTFLKLWLAVCSLHRVTATPPSSPSSEILYGLEDRVPGRAAWLVALQHVAAMGVGTITPPLLLGSILSFSPEETAYFVSLAFLASALGTFLQTRRRGPLGSGLLSVTGTSFSFLSPLIQAGQAGGLPAMFALSLVTAPLQAFIAPFLPRLRHVFTPLISGIVVLLIGLSLIPTAMTSIMTPLPGAAPSWAGPGLAALVLGGVLLAQLAGKPWLRLISVLPSLVLGYALCFFAGWLQPMPSSGAWLTVPRFSFSLEAVRWELVAPFAFVYFFSLLEAVGDMTATAQLAGLPTDTPAHWKRLRGGVLVDSLTSFVSAAFSAFPSTTYAQNNGVIQMTGVASRHIGPPLAIILAALGLFPPVGRWLAALPSPLLGALALLLFGLVAVSGLRLITQQPLSHRDALVVAVALAVGFGLPSQSAFFASAPRWLQAVAESGITSGGLTALILNGVLPGRRPLPSL